jgi:hypothetical protein
MMTRQHFQLIAEVLAQEAMAARVLDRGEAAEEQMRIVTANFAGRLAQTNPNFDQQRFIDVASGRKAS